MIKEILQIINTRLGTHIQMEIGKDYQVKDINNLGLYFSVDNKGSHLKAYMGGISETPNFRQQASFLCWKVFSKS